MLLPALALLLTMPAPQDPGPPPAAPLPSQALYQPPPIRPFEATGDLASSEPEGDSSSGTYRGAIRGPVALDEYDGQFEAGPTDAALAFDQGVVSAEMRMDQRMGRWTAPGSWSIRTAPF